MVLIICRYQGAVLRKTMKKLLVLSILTLLAVSCAAPATQGNGGNNPSSGEDATCDEGGGSGAGVGQPAYLRIKDFEKCTASESGLMVCDKPTNCTATFLCIPVTQPTDCPDTALAALKALKDFPACSPGGKIAGC